MTTALLALAVPRLVEDRAENLATLVRLAERAAGDGAELVLFPEAALTGLALRDEPGHDLALGEPVPGPATEALGRVARDRSLWIALGLLERTGGRLHDSAALISPEGEVRLKYRRVHPGWHAPDGDPRVYGRGREVPAAETPWGRTAILLCGDLFDDRVVSLARMSRPELLLVPFARSSEARPEPGWWELREAPAYAERVARVGCPALLANYLGPDGFFGGGLAASGDGEAIRTVPPGREGVFLVNLP